MKFNFTKMGKDILKSLEKHSPEILVGMGIVGMVTTTVLAVRATPKALKLMEEKKAKTAKEIVKATWKCYIPSVVTGAVSIACIVGASRINAKRNAALFTAYTLAETGLKEFKDKVTETVGEKKEKAIEDAIAKDHIDSHPIVNSEVVITGAGDTLCYDTTTSRYFMSNIEKLRRAENNLNARLLQEMYIPLNDYYDEIGLPPCEIGNDIGWNMDGGLIEFSYSSQIAGDGRPAIVVDFRIAPRYDFGRLM